MRDHSSLDETHARVAALPIWSGKVEAVPLGGGISNRNFTVEDGGRKYVVRVGGDKIVHGVIRATETAASRAAHAAGISPSVVHAEPGLMVLDFIEARTFSAEDVRHPANLERIVDLVRWAHRDIPKFLRGPAAIFWPFHVLRDYAHTLLEGASPHVTRLPNLLSNAERLEKAVGPIDVVYGHNDLLPANILDDGRRLWLIDWEYSGFGSPLFDLGGLASNSELPPEMRDKMLALYFGRDVDDGLRRRAAAMTAASLLRETMWSMVSEIHSPLDFDYAAYTVDNLARYEAAFRAFVDTEAS